MKGLKNNFAEFLIPALLPALLLMAGCRHHPPKHDITLNIQKLDENVQNDIGQIIGYLMETNGNIGDSNVLTHPAAVFSFYKSRNNRAGWSSSGEQNAAADSLMALIARAEDYGLEPSAFHYPTLENILRSVKTDTIARRDAVKWTHADLLLTDAFMGLADRLHYGNLPHDSITLRKDSAYSHSAKIALLTAALQSGHIQKTLLSLQPHHLQYQQLQQALTVFNKRYAHRFWKPLPDEKDSLALQRKIPVRLLQSGDLDSSDMNNPAAVDRALKNFQRLHNLYPDGIPGKRTLAALNISKENRFRQIALNLDRWRRLPDSLPQEYIWVNIPSFSMRLFRDDTIRLQSRVIVGKPGKQTPLLNSSMTNFQLYPYWRVPFSIIVNEMLPRIKKDTGYLRQNNLEVIDRHNRPVDPNTLNWKKYNKHYFPYLIRQMTGLDNSLGIIKFNFRNNYSVYLHDTNVRGLFGRSFRALSHGCVRVQQWDSLAMYLIRNDTLRHLRDSVRTWMEFEEQKLVSLRQRVPIFIRYFTCDVNKQGDLIFYDDVYGYDSTIIGSKRY